MKKLYSLLFSIGITPLCALAQSAVGGVDAELFLLNAKPDSSLLEYGSANRGKAVKAVDVSLRPDHVNNMKSVHFPPVFNQTGGSCGSASRIGYMLTHELNAYRGTDASLLENCFSTHFVWLLTHGNSGKGDFMRHVGVPSAVSYGGRTNSKLFGNQDEKTNDFGWMTGYDKWFEAMSNRIEKEVIIPAHTGTVEGREALKNWLWNHNGDTDFRVGGLAGIGVATGPLTKIASTPANDENGLTGMKCLDHWGDQVNHALTIVGYDDRVEFDLDGDKIYGEADADEKGAWIVVNSWGAGWGDGGAFYCPYAYGGKSCYVDDKGKYIFNQKTWWQVELLKVRKNYRPLRTIKVKMDYSRRSEIRLSAGVSDNVEATVPERIQLFDHFKFAGDGNRGNTNPAPEVPMLGRWADGQLHSEPMEFGYDLTDLSSGYDHTRPLKYFFIIETRSWAQGQGHVYGASILDYEFDKEGIEFPFDIQGENVEIKSQGNKTILSVVVQGDGCYAPVNLQLQGNEIVWKAPIFSTHKIQGYNIYKNDEVVEHVGADVTRYGLPVSETSRTYGVTAVYEGGMESSMEKVAVPVRHEGNIALDMRKAGFEITNVLNANADQAMIEFWYYPKSMKEASFESTFGNVFMNLLADGKITFGWDSNNRTTTVRPVVFANKWNHIALEVKGVEISLYINGFLFTSFTSRQFKGVQVNEKGRINFVMKSHHNVNSIEAFLDELRFWNVAKGRYYTSKETRSEFRGDVYPSELVGYFKGNLMIEHNESKLFDCVGAHHASFVGLDWRESSAEDLSLESYNEVPTVKINMQPGIIRVGEPVVLNADYGHGVTSLSWDIEALGIHQLKAKNPVFTFDKTGDYRVFVTAVNAGGEMVRDTATLNVTEAAEVSADFTLTKNVLAVGERVSMLVKSPVAGSIYEWSLPGADKENVRSHHVGVTYSQPGDYEATLKVTGVTGKEHSLTQKLKVIDIAPEADFDVSPYVLTRGTSAFLKDMSRYNPNSWVWTVKSEQNVYVVKGQNSTLTLDETGVYDVTLKASNAQGISQKTQKRALIVCNADSKSGLNFAGSGAHVDLTKVPFERVTSSFTIDWWMNPGRTSIAANGIGDNEQTMFIKTGGNGAMFVVLNKIESKSIDRYVIPNEWHHYAVCFKNGSINFYRDGKWCSSTTNRTKLVPVMKSFSIGLPNLPISGEIDEFRIWNKSFMRNEVEKFANAPISDIKEAEEKYGLLLYYDFNQDSGDVMDAGSRHNTGIRRGFGPDGDAWVSSDGVFCLNFKKSQRKEITRNYLKNYQSPFAHTGKLVNTSAVNRFYEIADWTLENTGNAGDCVTGIHVDTKKRSQMTCSTLWDGFGELVNHKAYQTITLPAGRYEFVTEYGSEPSSVGGNLLVAAEGKGLPDAVQCGTRALASTAILPKSKNVMSNALDFVLTEESEVSLGLVINMRGQKCMVLNRFHLYHEPVEVIDADGAKGYDLTVSSVGLASLYLPYSVSIPEGVTAYCAKGFEKGKVILEPVSDGIVSANTAVVIEAASGIYHFPISSKPGNSMSLLKGVTKDTPVRTDMRYYIWDGGEHSVFRLFEGGQLPANSIFFTSDLGDNLDSYGLKFVNVGIDGIEIDNAGPTDVYDVIGRRVIDPVKGVYISNGKKCLVK